jgi:16S rRNA (cytosine1402-N4)-methyltransferase
VRRVKVVGLVPHRPVLLEEAIRYLNVRSGGVYLDATVGAGGHSAAIAERLDGGLLIGLDRDASAIHLAEENLRQFGRLARLAQTPFSKFAGILDRFQIDRVDGVLCDLGVSSMQFDDLNRGFSFLSDADLDMRMDDTHGETAAELLERLGEQELVRIIGTYGEERFAGRIARHIVEERHKGMVFTGRGLRDLIHHAVPRNAKRERIDPATRTFQALRIAVNGEIGELESFLDGIIERVNRGGRIVIISFHSIEDGIVKRRFRQWAHPQGDPFGPPRRTPEPKRASVLTRKPVRPTEDEVIANARSRSARLRAVEIL